MFLFILRFSFYFAISLSFFFVLKQDSWVLRQRRGVAALLLKLGSFENEVEVSQGDFCFLSKNGYSHS